MGCYLPQNHLDDMQELQVHHEFLKRTHNLRLRLRQTLSRVSPLPFFFQTKKRRGTEEITGIGTGIFPCSRGSSGCSTRRRQGRSRAQQTAKIPPYKPRLPWLVYSVLQVLRSLRIEQAHLGFPGKSGMADCRQRRGRRDHRTQGC